MTPSSRNAVTLHSSYWLVAARRPTAVHLARWVGWSEPLCDMNAPGLRDRTPVPATRQQLLSLPLCRHCERLATHYAAMLTERAS